MSAPETPAGEHELPERHADEHDNRLLYAIAGVLAVVLVVIGLVAFGQARDNQDAKAKATQLEALLKRSGLDVPEDRNVIVRALSTDGGPVCKTAGKSLTGAILDQQLSAGGGGVGARPITVDADVLRGELAIISVYCPARASDFVKYFHDYDTDNVIKN